MSVITVTCPAGVAAGMPLSVMAPDGRQIQVMVPPGVGPGMQFQAWRGARGSSTWSRLRDCGANVYRRAHRPESFAQHLAHRAPQAQVPMAQVPVATMAQPVVVKQPQVMMAQPTPVVVVQQQVQYEQYCGSSCVLAAMPQSVALAVKAWLASANAHSAMKMCACVRGVCVAGAWRLCVRVWRLCVRACVTACDGQW